MELIYSMRRKPLKCEPPHFESSTDPEMVKPICTISVCNIIAFSSPTELQDAEGDTWGGFVYVCDMDTPWDAHKVTSMSHTVSVLEWDCEGKQLLIATTTGDVSVYGQKDYLLNDWTCLYTANFPGELMLAGIFFERGRRLAGPERKPDAPLTERGPAVRARATRRGFGGVGCEGACVLTATGLIVALGPPAAPPGGVEPPRALTATDSLRARRDHYISASFAHKNGTLVLAALHGCEGRYSVRCAAIAVARQTGATPTPPEIAARPLPTVYLAEGSVVASVRWVPPAADALAVSGRAAALYRLKERAHVPHKLLAKGPAQGNTTPGGGPKSVTDTFNTLCWAESGAAPTPGAALSCAAGRALLGASAALHLLNADSLQHICSRAIPGSPSGEGPPAKKAKYGAGAQQWGSSGVCSVAVSPGGGAAAALDARAQLAVYRLPQPWADAPAVSAPLLAAAALETCMVSGRDPLDLLLALRPPVTAEAVLERLTESFQRQPASVQQYYYHSWLKIRIALCRMVPSLTISAQWLSCAQSVLGTWAAAAGALRADDRPDQQPLAALLEDNYADLDKTLVALESKADTLNEALAPLAALRRPLRRAADIAASAVATAATQQHHHQQQYGVELLKEPLAVSALRRLLALRRCDGAAGRLVARLASAAAAGLKGDLVEECLSASPQLPGRVWDAAARCAISAPHRASTPLVLEYGTTPERLRAPSTPPPALQDAPPHHAVDAIRYMYLGGGRAPRAARACGRCGGRALPASLPARQPLQKAYDARFVHHCRCGGKWSLLSSA